MSWRVRRAANRRSNLVPLRATRSRRLRLEGLEERTVLAGVVNIDIFPNTGPGFLSLIGDGSNNQVEIRQTATPNEYFISSPDDTLFQINGAGATMPDATVNGIVNTINVSLGDGNDEFSFLGIDPATHSNVPSDLEIFNNDGSNTNLISHVHVNGNLTVSKNGSSSGYSETRIVNSDVIGDTQIDNVGVGTGDSRTIVDNSNLHAGGPSRWALRIDNAHGNNITEVLGQSQFGTGSFLDPTDPIVVINNAGGGSRTSFTGANQVAGAGTTTVYGKVEITNGENIPGLLDIITFNSVNVLGRVIVQNNDGDTESVVSDATLGSHLVPDDPSIGGPLEIYNNEGFDSFMMSDSNVPWGLLIDNAQSNTDSTWGSTTSILNSSIGEHPFGPTLPEEGDALKISGDNARDDISLDNTTLGGRLNLANLRNGDNSVWILNASSMAALHLQGGTGSETVTIDNSQIIVTVMIDLGDGADTLALLNLDPTTQWPSPLLGLIEIDGGAGVDTLDTTGSPGIFTSAVNFQVFVP